MMVHTLIWGFHSHVGTPIAGWLLLGKIQLEWMRTGGTPILGNLQYHNAQYHDFHGPKNQLPFDSLGF